MAGDQSSTTLAVLLGASRFPNAPQLVAGRAFYLSASDIEDYLSDERGLAIQPQNICSLFDDTRSSSEQLVELANFLQRRTADLKAKGSPARDLLIYYVGHGMFTRGDQAYCLAIRSTNEINEGATSIRASDLADVIKESAAFLRKYWILDCCFAGNLYKELQSGVLTAAHTQLAREFPKRGTAILCSSNVREVSLAPKGLAHTMFSDALIRALREGNEGAGARLSFSELGYLITEILRADWPDNWVRPEVHSPDQAEGDIAQIPLFPNPGYRQIQVPVEQTGMEAERDSKELSLKRDRVEAEQVANERIARDKAERDRVEAERVANERLARDKAERDRVEAERLARDRAERDRVEAERVANERLARDKAERDRVEAERVTNERLARDKAERDRVEAERVANERLARDKAAQDRVEAERVANERLARDKAAQDRVEAEWFAYNHARVKEEEERLEADRVHEQPLRAKAQEPIKVKEAVIAKAAPPPVSTPESTGSNWVTGLVIIVILTLTNVPTYFAGRYLASLANRDPIGNFITAMLHQGRGPLPDEYRLLGISILIFGLGAIFGRVIKKICDVGEWDVHYIAWAICPGFLVGFRFFNNILPENQPSLAFAVIGIGVYLAAALEGS